ncbi:MAG: hypothetical protein EA411_08080 [Saprospirales bacterium]|nr:MAG: hypothetical protein EA411_08080 [Saprospirales bacterium]
MVYGLGINAYFIANYIPQRHFCQLFALSGKHLRKTLQFIEIIIPGADTSALNCPAPRLNYCIELGGMGHSSRADRHAGEPPYSNGFITSVGMRFYFGEVGVKFYSLPRAQ